jgi:hypothetical protein
MSSKKTNSGTLAAEKRLLAEILINRAVYSRAIDAGIEAGTFLLPAHSEVWRAFGRLGSADFDTAGLVADLQQAGKLEQVGGMAWLISLEDVVATSANSRQTIEAVSEAARARSLAKEAQRMIEALEGGGGKIPEAVPVVLERMALALEGKGEQPILEMLDARAFSLGAAPAKPKLRVWLGGAQVCTSGNLSALIAQAKAGKSTVVGAIISAFLGASEAESFGFKAANPEGFAVLHFDTEQSNWDSDQLIRRAMARARTSTLPGWFQSYRLAGLQPKQVRECINRAVARAARTCGGLALVIIDGVADAVIDVNDPDECNPYVAELHGLAIRHDVPILSIIHQNPTSGLRPKSPETAKARGHLGSQLERKCESNIYITKNDDGISVLWSDKMRGAPIPLTRGPAFAWSDEHSRHVIVANPFSDEIAQPDLNEELREIMRAGWPVNGESIKLVDLARQIAARAGMSERTARRKVLAAIEAGVLEEIDGVLRWCEK